MSRRLLHVVLCSCIFMSAAFSAARGDSPLPAQPHAADQVPPVLDMNQVLDALGLSQVDIISLDAPLQPGEAFTMALSLGGETIHLELERHVLRSDNFKLIAIDEFGWHETPAPEAVTYRGRVLDADGNVIPGSGVAAGVINAQLTAMIDMGNGQAWFVQPLSEAGIAAAAHEHALYLGEHVLPSDRHCGVETDDIATQPEGEPGDGPQPRGTTGYKVTDVAFEADFPFYQLNSSNVTNTMADIEIVMNTVEFIYERDTAITYEITWIFVRTSADPYSTTNCGTLLDQFRAEWIANFGAVPRDIAHLMTGRNLAGGCLGVAWLGTVCDSFGGLPYALSESRWSVNFNNRVVVTAHELGHNWSADHCNDIGNACNIMCSNVGSCGGYGLPDFSAFEQNQIEAYRNDPFDADCLFPPGQADTLESPIPVPLLDSIPNSVLDPAIWIYADGAVASTAAENEPSGLRSINLDSTGSGQFDQNEVRTNFILMSGQSPVDVSYKTQHRGVEAGEQLIVEYWASNFRWINLNTIDSNGVTQSNFVDHVHSISSQSHPTAFHNEFRLRFRVIGTDGSDDWFIDDISISPSGVDAEPPTPNPMSFASTPAPIATDQLQMTATTATDPSGVTYIFTNATLGFLQTESATPQFTATGLQPNTLYSITVAARDNSPLENTTNSSSFANGITFIQTPQGIDIGTITDTSIQVTALGTFSNLNVPSSGLFFEMTPAHGSGANVWVQSQTITVTGLTPGTEYTFRVQARNRNAITTPFTAPVNASTTAPATGACCQNGGTCVIATAAQCSAESGTYNGDGSPCDPNPCEQPCLLTGDVNSDALIDGADIPGFTRVKLGVPEAGDNEACADYGGTLEDDIAAFIADLLQ